MKVETLACNNCGAPLSVPPTANFATCAHCNSTLAIHRTESARYTEVIERLEEQTERLDEELRDLRLEHELIKLEQQWEEERTEYKSSSKDGQFHEPSIQRAVTVLLLTLGMPIFLSVFMPRFGGGFSSFDILLVIIPIVGLILAAKEYGTYKQYENARARYYERRDALLNSRGQNLS